MGSELPPPAYQLTDAEVDRKIADAAQRSLNELPQPARPTLPPIDEDGFPLWDEALFEYNRQQREYEREQQNSKLRSEYVPRPAPASVPSAASSSSSPPQTPAQVPTFAPSQPMRALSPVAQAKQKEEAPRWFENNNSGRIMQDDDPVPEMGGLNVGRPPAQYSHVPNQNLQQARVQTQNQARPAIQVQVGPRPHDVLAQPTSPVSDPEDDPLLSNGGASGLSRAPTYRPMGYVRPNPAPTPTPAADPSELNRAPTYRSMTTGQIPYGDDQDLDRAPTYRTARPGHAQVRAATDRAPARSDTMMSNASAELPAWTAHAPSLEGPAYEEVVGQAAGRRPTSGGSGAGTREWQGIQARPQVQERVGGARRSTGAPIGGGGAPYGSSGGVPYGPSGAPPPPPPQTRTTLPRAPVAPTPTVTMTYTPLGAASGPGGYDVGAAYRASQQYSLGRSDTVSTMTEAQMVLRTEGANAFYPVAVASTMKTTVAFQAPPPPPKIRSPVEDDRSSVFSGRSGGRQGSVYNGGAGARTSVYSPNMGGIGEPGNGIMGGGAVRPSPGPEDFNAGAPNRMSYVPQFQPGAQVPGAGGYQSNFQPGMYQPPIGQPGGYQPQPQRSDTASAPFQYQPQATSPQTPLAYQPQSPSFIPIQQAPAQQAPMVYQPQTYQRPLPVPGAVMGPGLFNATGGPGVQAGGYAPAAPGAGGFQLPPPPPPSGASQPAPVGPGGFVQPGRKPGKLYKRL
ncbi:hypothetical protein BDV93DRAFT_519948 [Ceratobasidium sp. AG-I]|nr:hypothetical protein BDV93DRAFT_519948 [Ceratobasidium sp. AG-I]